MSYIQFECDMNNTEGANPEGASDSTGSGLGPTRLYSLEMPVTSTRSPGYLLVQPGYTYGGFLQLPPIGFTRTAHRTQENTLFMSHGLSIQDQPNGRAA